MTVPGTQFPVMVPSELLGALLLSEWEGGLSRTRETPAPLVALSCIGC